MTTTTVHLLAVLMGVAFSPAPKEAGLPFAPRAMERTTRKSEHVVQLQGFGAPLPYAIELPPGWDGEYWDRPLRYAAQQLDLSREQAQRVVSLFVEFDERAEDLWSARAQLAEDVERLRYQGVPFDENEALAASLELDQLADAQYREIMSRIRKDILTPEQLPLADRLDKHFLGNPISFMMTMGGGGIRKLQIEALTRLPDGNSQQSRAEKIFTGKGFVEEEWASWLEAVVERAALEAEPKMKASDMLAVARAAAQEYRRNNEMRYREIAGRLSTQPNVVDVDPVRKEARRAALEEAAALVRPIDDIGARFRADVLSLLTVAQKSKLRGMTTGLWRVETAGRYSAERAYRFFAQPESFGEELTKWLTSVDAKTKFTDAQRTDAREKLGFAKEAAEDVRKSRAEEFQKLSAEVAAAEAADPPAPERRIAVRKAVIELAAPIEEIARRFRGDVVNLLSREQKRKIGR